MKQIFKGLTTWDDTLIILDPSFLESNNIKPLIWLYMDVSLYDIQFDRCLTWCLQHLQWKSSTNNDEWHWNFLCSISRLHTNNRVNEISNLCLTHPHQLFSVKENDLFFNYVIHIMLIRRRLPSCACCYFEKWWL